MVRRAAAAVALAVALAGASCGTSPDAADPVTVGGLRYGSLTERTVDPAADGADVVAAVEGLDRFAIDLYRSLAGREGGNVVVSPYSINLALGMIYAGAAGDTATEMASVLHVDLPPDRWHEAVNALDLSLDARTAGSPTDWASANEVWSLPGLPLENAYLDVLTGAYGSPLAEADFSGDPDGSRDEINRWVADRTADLIPELFPPGSLAPLTALVLVNAVALDAPWEFPFDPASTVTQPFTPRRRHHGRRGDDALRRVPPEPCRRLGRRGRAPIR